MGSVGHLPSFAWKPSSDGENGAVIRVKNGPALVQSLASHHYLLTTGHNETVIRMLGTIFDVSVESL